MDRDLDNDLDREIHRYMDNFNPDIKWIAMPEPSSND